MVTDLGREEWSCACAHEVRDAVAEPSLVDPSKRPRFPAVEFVLGPLKRAYGIEYLRAIRVFSSCRCQNIEVLFLLVEEEK
jgi:hypothetical protein